MTGIADEDMDEQDILKECIYVQCVVHVCTFCQNYAIPILVATKLLVKANVCMDIWCVCRRVMRVSIYEYIIHKECEYV